MRIYYVLLVLVFAVYGCKLIEPEAVVEYQTVPANSQRDTATARREHDKALRLLEKPHRTDKHEAKAEQHLQKALIADVTYGPAHNSLGMHYYRRHEFYLAAWEFDFAARLMPGRAEPLYNQGLVLEAVGKLDEAVQMYFAAYAVDPSKPHVIGNLARAQIRNGTDIEEVKPFLEELLLYDRRGNWVAWARELLGLNPSPDLPETISDSEELPAADGVTDDLPDLLMPEN